MYSKRNFNYFFFKRIFDVVFSYTFLIIFSPLIILISIFIFTTSKGPVIYKQRRLGLHGKEIYIFKFRTMFVGSEHKLQNLLENNKVLREEYNVKKKLLNDPRTTLIGKFLRRSSLDEIPQFINVINGEMSVI